MDDELVLPPGARLIHIGPPKTGTTSLQRVMHDSRAVLARHGVHFAGPTSRPADAGRELIVEAPRRPGHPLEQWNALVAEVAAAGDRRVLVSNEGLAAANDDQAARIVRDLGDDRAHVVSSVRRLDRLLPSQWQQRVRRRPGTPAYEDWLRIVLEEKSDDPHWEHFWSHHDLRATRDRWVAAADADRVTFVVLDEDDRGLLPRTFERLLGLPEGFLTSRAASASASATGSGSGSMASNRSLTRTEADLVFRVNEVAHARGWSTTEYQQVMRALSASLRQRPPAGEGIATPAWAVDRIRELSEERLALVRSSGVRVIGDLETLQSRSDVSPGSEPSRPEALAASTAGELIGAVAESLLTRVRQAERRTDTATQRVERVKERLARRSELETTPSGRPVSGTSGQDLVKELGRRLRRRMGRSQ